MNHPHTGERIVLASNNAGKVREFSQLLAQASVQVIPQGELGVPEAEETGLSFVENAILKARNAAAHSGLAAIADDSGLEVDALEGPRGSTPPAMPAPGRAMRTIWPASWPPWRG